jgi:hypothetical protein
MGSNPRLGNLEKVKFLNIYAISYGRNEIKPKKGY